LAKKPTQEIISQSSFKANPDYLATDSIASLLSNSSREIPKIESQRQSILLNKIKKWKEQRSESINSIKNIEDEMI